MRTSLCHLFRLVIVVSVLVSGLAADGEKFTGRVVAIMDGDTIKILHNGRAEKVRIFVSVR